MPKSITAYAPRQGSKVFRAIAALRGGPKTTQQLGCIMNCASDAVHALLRRPLSHAAIVKYRDADGRLHFALPEMIDAAQPMATNKEKECGSLALVSSNVRLFERESRHATDHGFATHDIIAGLFSDGELTIAVDGECIRLNTAQRQQLYVYLHKIRHLA